MPIHAPASSSTSSSDVRSLFFLFPNLTTVDFSDYDSEAHVIFQSSSDCYISLDVVSPGRCLYFRNDGEGDLFVTSHTGNSVLRVNGETLPYGKVVRWKNPSAYGGILCEARFDDDSNSGFFYLMGEFDLVDSPSGGSS